jgi:transposase-like protein
MTDSLEALLSEPWLRALLRLPRWSPEQTALITQAQRRSGLSRAAFCRRAGIKLWRLYKWRGQPASPTHVSPAPQLEDSAPPLDPALPPSFVQLQLLASAPAEQAATPCAELVHPSGLRLRLWPQAPQALVLTLFQALGPPC